MRGLCSWNVLRVFECLSSMGYPILRSISQDVLVVLDGSILRVILPLRNILCHKNVPMIIQSIDSTGYLSLVHSPLAHSIKLPHPEYSYMQTTRPSTDDNEVHPKNRKRGVEDAAVGHNGMRLYRLPHTS